MALNFILHPDGEILLLYLAFVLEDQLSGLKAFAHKFIFLGYVLASSFCLKTKENFTPDIKKLAPASNHVYNATTCTGNIMAGNFECLCIHSELFRFVQLAELDFCMLGTSVSPTKAISLYVNLQRNSRVNQR